MLSLSQTVTGLIATLEPLCEELAHSHWVRVDLFGFIGFHPQREAIGVSQTL